MSFKDYLPAVDLEKVDWKKFSKMFKGAPKLQWQKLRSGHRKVVDMYRSPVVGGWLITNGENGALVFIPDPEHHWNGASFPLNLEQDEE